MCPQEQLTQNNNFFYHPYIEKQAEGDLPNTSANYFYRSSESSCKFKYHNITIEVASRSLKCIYLLVVVTEAPQS